MRYQVGLYVKSKIRYELSFYHNINILDDFSATGKSTLVKILSESSRQISKLRNVQVFGDLHMQILTEKDFIKSSIDSEDTLYLIEEGTIRGLDNKIASLIEDSNLKFLIISRRSDFRNLPIDIEAIYKIESTKSKGVIVNTNIHKYLDIYSKLSINNHTIVEDSSAGYQFFTKIFQNCISSYGNGNIIPMLENNINVILDTVCFGGYIEEYLKEIKSSEYINVRLADVKSFEFLMLKYISHLNDKEIAELIFNWDFELYKSLERLFYSELKRLTMYSKSSLSSLGNFEQAIKMFINEYISKRKSLSSSLQD